jgi:large subunit ribosomal protein L17
MRHRKRGRHLGRTSSHRKALLKNLASSLFLTERDVDPDLEENAPKVKGRIVTTLEKAREVRPLVEKCITIACRSMQAQAEARQYATSAERNSDEWKRWRASPQWQSWAQAMGPVVAARRRVLQMIGDKQAVRVLFGGIAPRFEQRDGGYTRILKLANPRLGDAGKRAVLELVGGHERVKPVSEKPQFDVADSTSSGSSAD